MLTAQRGQALVAVMVVMLILFALAGAVAIGAGSLILRRGESGVTNDDFRVRSALNDAVAQVQGAPTLCGTAGTSAANLTLTLPPPDNPVQGWCSRSDNALLDSVQNLALNSGCATYPLNINGPAWAAVLMTLHTSSAGWAYVDNSSAKPSQLSCRDPFFIPGGRTGPCTAQWAASNRTQQAALTCQFNQGDQAYLHVDASSAVVDHAWIAQQIDSSQVSSTDPSTFGRLVLLAIQEPVNNAAMEEAVLLLTKDGRTTRLITEAALP